MSLINQMLKDLEKRQKKNKSSISDAIQGLSVSRIMEGQQINFKLWAGILGIFIIGLFVVHRMEVAAEPTYPSPTLAGKKVGVPKDQPMIDPVTKTVFDSITQSNAPETILPQATPASEYLPKETQQAVAPAPAVSSEHVPLSEVNTLNKVEWQEGHQMMTMQMHLMKEIPYDVVIDDTHNVVHLTLPKTILSQQNILNMTSNPFVSQVHANQEGHFLKLDIQLSEGVQLQRADFLSDAADPILALAFASTQVVNEPVTHSPINKVMVPLSRDQRAEIARQDAIALAEKGNADGAITLLENSIQLHPDYALTRETLVSILIDKGDLSYAKEVLSASLFKFPKHIPFIMLQARLDIAENNLSSAEAIMRTVSPSIDENVDYFVLEASLAQKMKKFDVSQQLYADLIKHDPANGSWWMGYGISLENNDKKNAALIAYKRAVQTQNLSSELRAYTNQRIVALGG